LSGGDRAVKIIFRRIEMKIEEITMSNNRLFWKALVLILVSVITAVFTGCTSAKFYYFEDGAAVETQAVLKIVTPGLVVVKCDEIRVNWKGLSFADTTVYLPPGPHILTVEFSIYDSFAYRSSITPTGEFAGTDMMGSKRTVNAHLGDNFVAGRTYQLIYDSGFYLVAIADEQAR
jgi:hypothetical protein